MESFQPVHGPEHIGVQNRLRAVDKIIHEQIANQKLRIGRYLPTAAELEGLVAYRLKAPSIPIDGESQSHHVERHELQAAFQHDGPGQTRIVFEMRSKQPAIGTYRVLGAAMTATPGSAFQLQFRDGVEKEKLATCERRRPLLCPRKFKSFSKALVGATLGCSANLSFVEMCCDVRHARNG